MRDDARNLLERLGASDVFYCEFPDQFGDLEKWPLFEALRSDPVLSAQIDAVSAKALSFGADARAMQKHLAALNDAGAL